MKKFILLILFIAGIFTFEALAVVSELSFKDKMPIILVGLWIMWWYFDIYRLYRKASAKDVIRK